MLKIYIQYYFITENKKTTEIFNDIFNEIFL